MCKSCFLAIFLEKHKLRSHKYNVHSGLHGKKRGKKKFPRKTLFKPEKRINVGKDPLWREIFIDNDSESSDESLDE